MRVAILLGLVFALACGDDASGDAGVDAAFDANVDASVSGDLRLVLRAPSRSPTNEYLPIAIELIDTRTARRHWPQPATLVDLASRDWRDDASMARGASAAWTNPPLNPGDYVVEVRVAELSTSISIAKVDLPDRALTGALVGDDLSWTPEAVVRLSGTTIVPAGSTLTIEPGTHVRLAAGARLEVEGDLVAGGEGEPVTIFASDRFDPFAQIHHLAGDAIYTNVFISGGGAGDWTHAEYRHCCIPMVYAEGGTLTVDRAVFFDTPTAKGILTENTDVVIRDSIFSGLGFGTEHFNEPPHTVLIEDSAYLEMRGDDDDDAIYFWQLGEARVSRTTITGVDDDGIDLESATAVLEDVLIEDATDKCVSVTNEGPTVRNAFFRACRVGVKVDGTAAAGRFERVTMVELLEEGVRLSDREGSQPDARILPVFDRVILGPVRTPLLTDYDPLDATFNNSVLPAELGTSGDGNVVGEPELEGYEPRSGSAAAMLGAGFRGW